MGGHQIGRDDTLDGLLETCRAVAASSAEARRSAGEAIQRSHMMRDASARLRQQCADLRTAHQARRLPSMHQPGI
jgi:hypothetical protein